MNEFEAIGGEQNHLREPSHLSKRVPDAGTGCKKIYP